MNNINKTAFIIVLLTSLITGCKDDLENTVTGFSLESITLTEGNTLNTQSLIVQVKGALQSDISVSYEIKEGSAKLIQDVKSTSGQLTILASQSNAKVDVEIVGDSNLELTESFDLVITYEGKEYPLPVEIADDDPMEEILVSSTGFYTSNVHPSMQLIWSDDFSGTQLNTKNWAYDLGNGCSVGICGWGNNELQTYTKDPANIQVANGVVTITALNNVGNYTSARIKTQGNVNVQYGRIDVRARLPRGRGIWPAIWMLGENITAVNWPACGEIDIMELVGHEPQKVHGTVHYSSDGYKTSTGSTSLSAGDFSDEFHVFTIIWEKNKITWYVDNKSFKTFDVTVATFNKPFFFILNLAVGGNWPGPPDATTVFSQEMVVDYVRVFQ
jgi:Glycosyl hydrolases family 16/Calx-beta domain